jgi:hypothetical protein
MFNVFFEFSRGLARDLVDDVRDNYGRPSAMSEVLRKEMVIQWCVEMF